MAQNGNGNVWSQVSRYTGLAFILPISTLVGWVIGWLLDKLFHTHFLYLVFIGFGIVAGFIELIRELNTQTSRDGS
jgi:F0F1-type ATP synthase assembly protein I